MSLLIVGTVAFDTIESAHGRAERIVGGSAQYAGFAASHFVDKVNLVSIIGDDFPSEELAEFASRGMVLDGIKTIAGGKSFFWEGKYHDDMNGRDTITTDLNVLAEFDPVLPNSYKTSEYILLGNLDPAIQVSVIEQLEVKPKLVVLDTMNFWIDIALPTLLKAISLCDVLTINDEEARMLSGEHSLVKAAAKILDMGPTYLIIKKGEHGAFLFDKNNVFFGPALPLETVIDPTGAGDCFAGGFLGHIAQSGDTSFENLKRALIYGAAMGSFVVEEFGNGSIRKVTKDTLQGRVQEFVKLTNFAL
ncbi:MAG: PfkB family carbohydrate kinase [Bacteroidota bacterium]